MGVERQTNIHTNTHTFRKTISGNQMHVPGLKIGKKIIAHGWHYNVNVFLWVTTDYLSSSIRVKG